MVNILGDHWRWLRLGGFSVFDILGSCWHLLWLGSFSAFDDLGNLSNRQSQAVGIMLLLEGREELLFENAISLGVSQD